MEFVQSRKGDNQVGFFNFLILCSVLRPSVCNAHADDLNNEPRQFARLTFIEHDKAEIKRIQGRYRKGRLVLPIFKGTVS